MGANMFKNLKNLYVGYTPSRQPKHAVGCAAFTFCNLWMQGWQNSKVGFHGLKIF